MPTNSAIEPAANVQQDNYDWEARRAQKQTAALARSHNLIFIGDSITHRFEREDGGLTLWEKHYEPLGALNLGYGWDTTQNVLWRLENGEFAGQQPKLVVLNIGTNNLTGNSACRPNSVAEIVAGIEAIYDFVQTRSPQTVILVMAVFPRGLITETIHMRVQDLNALLRVWVTGRPRMLHLDIGGRFLDTEGQVRTDLLPDRCHPIEPGYAIWAEELAPFVKRYVE